MQRLLLIAAWILVLTPLSWGVARSVQRSMPLFTAGPSTTADQATLAPSGSGPSTPTSRSGTPSPTKP